MTELIITWQGLLFEAVSFLIFTYLLNLFLFRPVRAILKKRDEVIGSNADKQKDFEKLAEALNFEAEKEKQNLKFALKEMKETLHKEVQAEANNILSDAKIRAADNFNKAMGEFNRAKISITGSLKESARDLSVLISRKIIE